MIKKHNLIDQFIENGIYLYIFLMFLAKGEGIRNILIFGCFGLWLLTLRQRNNLDTLKKLIPMLWWIYLGTILVAVIFSIDPLYSFTEVKGEPLKGALLFPVIATVCADEKRLLKVLYTSFLTVAVLIFSGYYSYIFLDVPFLKPHTTFVHAHYNKFAGYINTLLPFAFILYFILNKRYMKIIILILLSITVVAIVLSTSRGGLIAFLCIASIWSFYLSKTAGYSFRKIMAYLIIVVVMVGTISFFTFSGVRERILQTSLYISTLSLRTDLWKSAMFAIKKRPLRGWGYGHKVFRKDEPFEGNPFEKDPEKGTHNLFLSILFQQGLIGLVAFLLLIAAAIVIFWRDAFSSTGMRSYVLIACASVLLGNYVVHAMLESMFKLHHTAVLLGLGIAAKSIKRREI